MIIKAGKNSQINPKRRLEDQFGIQYTVIIEDVEIEGTLNMYDSVGDFIILKEDTPKFQ